MKNPHKLICVQALSSLSLWLDIFLVFTVPVYMWQASSSSIAMLAFCLGAPMLFLGPILGTLIDRQDVRKTLILGAILRIASTIGLAFSPSFNVFLGLIVLKSISNLVYFPSITVAVQQLISTDERKSFFSSVSLLDQSSKILAPLLAGLLTVILLPNNIFLLSAASVLFSLPILVSLCTVIQPKHECPPSKVLSLYRDILRGFSIYKLLPFQLRIGFLYSLLTSLALGVYDPHLASFLAYEGLPPGVFSMIISATAAGAVCAALLVKFKLKTVDEMVIRTYALVIFSIALLATATLILLQTPGRQFLYPAVWFINGFGYELLIISSSIILQQLCPSENIGRVSTSFRSIQILCVIIGPILGTVLITAGGRATPFVMAASAAFFTALMSIVVYFFYYRKPVYTL